MGQAKRRGSFEERKKQAVIRNVAARLDRKMYRDGLTKQQVEEMKNVAAVTAFVASMEDNELVPGL